MIANCDKARTAMERISIPLLFITIKAFSTEYSFFGSFHVAKGLSCWWYTMELTFFVIIAFYFCHMTLYLHMQACHSSITANICFDRALTLYCFMVCITHVLKKYYSYNNKMVCKKVLLFQSTFMAAERFKPATKVVLWLSKVKYGLSNNSQLKPAGRVWAQIAILPNLEMSLTWFGLIFTWLGSHWQQVPGELC